MSSNRTKALCFVVMVTTLLSRSSGQRSFSDHTFERDQVLSIKLLNATEEIKLRKIFSRHQEEVFYWKTRPLEEPDVSKNGKVVHVHVMSHVVQEVKEALTSFGLQFHVLVENLKRLMDAEKEGNTKRRRKRSTEDMREALLGFYPTYEELTSWLKNLATAYPSHVSLESAGQTFECRDIHLLKIEALGNKHKKKPGFWIDAGIHAREWITISSAVFVISQLLKAVTGNCTMSEYECSLASSFHWHIVPLVNPDGYSYTQVDRLWRKNRSRKSGSLQCQGVDLNRNFDVDWGKHFTSNETCDELYGGPYPGSENETTSLMAYWTKNKDDLQAWLTLHSYGQFLMNRWSHVLINNTEEYNETLSVMKLASSNIFNFSGYKYMAGSSPEVLYTFSGGSADWFRQNSRTKHVYEMELRDKGRLNFILPPSEIIPTAIEAVISVMTIASVVINEYSSASYLTIPFYSILSAHLWILLL